MYGSRWKAALAITASACLAVTAMAVGTGWAIPGGLSAGRVAAAVDRGDLELAWGDVAVSRRGRQWCYEDRAANGALISSGSFGIVQRSLWRPRAYHNLIRGPGMGAAPGPALSVLVVPLYPFLPLLGIAAGLAIRLWLPVRGLRAWHCRCRYDLRGAPGPTCPECGRRSAWLRRLVARLFGRSRPPEAAGSRVGVLTPAL